MTRAAVLCGLGGYLPQRVVENDEIAARFGVDDDWIAQRTGIRTRRWAGEHEATSDLAAAAAARALRSAGGVAVDTVIVATATPDYAMPATAPIVAARLDLGPVAAFDVNAVCSGFIYGLATGAGLIASGTSQGVLLIGADLFSRIIGPDDKVVMPLFGDGAGAVVLRPGEPGDQGALGPFDLGSDGDRSDLIIVRAGGSRHRTPLEPTDAFLALRGREVFSNAVQRMAESCRQVMGKAGWDPGDVDRVVGHQANLRILRSLAAQLEVPSDRLITNIAEVGNTSAASIPLALVHGQRERTLTAGQRILVTAFGSGLTWGSTALRWPAMNIQDEEQVT